jgi:hypothetical protein
MQDPRWSQLKHCLLERGWTWREDTLYAPHQTMWFKTSVENPNFANLRDRMSLVAEATEPHVAQSVDKLHLHDDLVSLVEALDEMLAN